MKLDPGAKVMAWAAFGFCALMAGVLAVIVAFG